MAVMHKGNRLYKTRNCNALACKHSHARVNSFLRAQKSLLCACKSLYFFIYFVILRKSMKNPEKIQIFTDNCTIYQYNAV